MKSQLWAVDAVGLRFTPFQPALLVQLEPEQARLLDQVCNGALLTETDLRAAGALCATVNAPAGGNPSSEKQSELFRP